MVSQVSKFKEESKSMTQQSTKSLDMTGIFFSSLCAAHCLLLPTVASFAPTVTHQFENEWVHIGLLLALVPLALVSFSKSIKKKRNYKPMVVGGIGIVSLVSAVALEGLEIPNLETILTVIGSILLVTAHYINLKG